MATAQGGYLDGHSTSEVLAKDPAGPRVNTRRVLLSRPEDPALSAVASHTHTQLLRIV